MDETLDDPRRRSAETKRRRSRESLLSSARELFRTRGWGGTRMEDIAATAGVSTATAYNHFSSKHAIMAHAYRPVLESALAPPSPESLHPPAILESIRLHVGSLANATRDEQALTLAFIGAVQDATVLRAGGAPEPGDPDDPRSIVPLPMHLSALLIQGQEAGQLRPFPHGHDVAVSVTNLLLLRIQNRPRETAAETTEIILTFLFGALRPDLLVSAGPTGRPFADAVKGSCRESNRNVGGSTP